MAGGTIIGRTVQIRNWLPNLRNSHDLHTPVTQHLRIRQRGDTVLEEWIILKLRDEDSIPELDGIKVQITEHAVA